MTKTRQIMINLFIISLLTSCTNISATSWVKPVCVSKDDVLTDGTARQILTLDETLGKPCKK